MVKLFALFSTVASVVSAVVGIVKRFAGPPAGSIQGHLNVVELGKVIITAVLAGGGLVGVLTGVGADVSAIFPSPGDAALAATVLSALIDAGRRLGHGVSVTLPPNLSIRDFA